MIIDTNIVDPFWNLAVEEELLEAVSEPILYLWQNERTIVIGKHQNPWREVKVSEFEADGGKLARRLSGGGAVFHDLGNLNFTFVLPRAMYDTQRTTSVLLRVMHRLQIPAEQTGRNDLTVQGRKFSGNAFCVRKNGAYHHGTILFQVDLAQMSQYLTVDTEKMRSKGIRSVAARVVNLCEYRPDIGIADLKEAFCEAFLLEFGDSVQLQTAPTPSRAMYEKYASWQWRFGESPAFDIELSHRFSWGNVTLLISAKDGLITNATVYTDAMDPRLGDDIPEALRGCAYSKEGICRAITAACASGFGAVVPELTAWLQQELS